MRDNRDNQRIIEMFAGIISTLDAFRVNNDDNIRPVLGLCAKTLGADFIHYNILEGESLRNRSYWGSSHRPVFREKADRYLCFDAISLGKDAPYYVPDISQPEFTGKNEELLRLGIRSYLGYPVSIAHTIQGVVCAFFREVFEPDETELIFLKLASHIVGMEEERLLNQDTHSAGEKKYRELYQMLRLMCDNVTDMIWAKDINNRYLFANEKFCQTILLAEDTDEPVGKNDMFFATRQREAHPDDATWHTFGEICRDSDTVVIETLKPHQFNEYGNIRGKYIYLDVHKAPFLDTDGKLLGTVGSGRDVTQAKATELALIESQERYKALMDANPDLIFLYDNEGKFLDCHCNNPDVLILPAEELIGSSVYDHFSRELADECVRYIHQAHETGEVAIQEYTLHLAKSDFFEARFVPLGQDKCLSIIRDITAKKLGESQLKESEARYRRLYESANEGIIIMDVDHEITEVNSKTCAMIGYTEAEIIGRKASDFVNDDDLPDYRKRLQRRMLGQHDSYETRLKAKDGSILWVIISATSIIDDNGNFSGSFGMIQDITARKNLELSLTNSIAKYELQRNTLSNVSLSPLVMEGDLELLAEEVTRIAAYTMDTRRVSIWLFNKEYTRLECVRLFDTETREHTSGTYLTIEEYSSEFSYLKSAKYIDASDPYKDPRTIGYIDRYLIPNQITSMLDAVIRISGKEYGLICFEHVNFCHEWEQNEISFACQMADQLALCITNRERKQAEGDLRISDERYKLLLEIAQVGIGVFEDTRIIYLNPKGADLVGYDDPDQLIGADIRKFIPDAIIDTVLERLEVIKKGSSEHYPLEFHLIRKDGKPIPVEARATILDYGNHSAVQFIFSDISDRKQAAENISRNIDRLTSILNIVQSKIDDTKEFYALALSEAIRLTESTQGIFLIKSQTDLHNYEIACSLPKDRDAFEVGQRSLTISPGSIWWDPSTNGIPRIDNSFRYADHTMDDLEKLSTDLFRTMILPVKVDEEIVAMIALANKEDNYDETDSLQISLLMDSVWKVLESQKSNEQIRKLSRAVEQSLLSVVITDIEGNIEYVNEFFSEVSGYQKNQVIGKNLRFMQSGQTSLQTYQQLWQTITSGDTWTGELLNKRANGELFWEFASINPVMDNRGKIINYIGIKEDITLQKKMTQDLIKARDEAEQLNRLKSTFLANMSHELRTPMVGILGYSELLQEMIKDEAQKEMVNTINSSGKRLLTTLNMILDLSRIEANDQEISMTVFNLVDFIRNQVKLFRAHATKRKLTLEMSSDTPKLLLYSDIRLLEHVVSDLINNAIKFTEKGSIQVHVGTVINETGRFATISISDTGIGIPKDRQEVIFEGFRQVSEGYDRSYDGTGLGLTISKKYVQMLGGSITVESQINRGSTFTVSFPEQFLRDGDQREAMQNQQFRKGSNPHGEGSNQKPVLLLIDDDEVSYRLMERVLRDIAILDHAETGETGISMAKQTKYPVILVDINLRKGMSGLHLLKELRNLPSYMQVPVIAVTAYSMVGDKERFLAAGCTHYLSKPYDHEELRDLIRGVIS
ncbi:MAG TPA: PAS domain S-box protein [Candidatus Cloacimonadota bacterium]|nr:PAS domain S-box protein [Candidatus Cloacimonadota bacterium]